VSVDPREFGRLEGEVIAMRREIDELRDDVKKLLAAVENARGGWRTLLMVGAAAGALGGLITKGFAMLKGIS
jgi:hypothetical protein